MTYHTQRPTRIQRAWHGLTSLGRTAIGDARALIRRRVLASVVVTLTAFLGIGVVTAQPASAALTYYTAENTGAYLMLDNQGQRLSGYAVTIDWFEGTDRQRWGLQYLGMGYYNVINALSGMCMSADGSNPPSWDNRVFQSPCSNAAGQSWVLSNVRGNGVYEFRLTYNGPCLDISGTGAGSATVVKPCNGGASQGWWLNVG
jgi:hypothetical protein